MRSVKVSFISLLLLTAAIGGINWKAVWLEPHMPVLLTPGTETNYTVKGLNGRNVTADLTASPHLRIVSSDPDVVEVDRTRNTFIGFIGKKPGHAQIHISFGDATAIVQAFVKEQ